MRQREGGYVLLAMVVVLMAVAAVFLIQGLGSTIASNTREDQQRAFAAMREAKLALIARSVSQDNTPGAMLCPVLKEGSTSNSCSRSFNPTTPDHIGCVPWRTLGLVPHYMQGIGPLLYELSPAFNNNYPTADRAGSLSDQINPSNLGALTLTHAGNGSVEPVIGAILYPGLPLEGQSRLSVLDKDKCGYAQMAQYFEPIKTVSGQSLSNANAQGKLVVSASSDTFNDLVLPITSTDLYKAALPVVLQPFGASQTSPTTGLRWFLNWRSLDASALSAVGGKINRTGFMEAANLGPDIGKTQARCLAKLELDGRLTTDPSERITDFCFDRLFDPTAPLQGKGGFDARGNSVCNAPQSGYAQAAGWLCANSWYDYISYQPNSASGKTLLTLSIPLNSSMRYECSLDIDRRLPTCSTTQ